MSNFYTEPFVSAGEMEFPSQPYITAQPQNHTATGPEEYVLKVIAAGAVSYQWEVFDGESWSTIIGATSDTLTINIDSSMNGWRYRVLVTGADGSTVVSKAAQIAVKGVQEITLEGAIVTFDGPARIKSLEVDINAVQDLHGQTNPYPAGGGKNLLNPTKWHLSPVSWGGVTMSNNGELIVLSGTATSSGGRTNIACEPITLKAGTYCISQFDLSETAPQFVVQKFESGVFTVLIDRANASFNLTEDTTIVVGFNITNGTTYNTSFHAEISEGATAPTEWTPYENICPISGRDSVNVDVRGINQWDEEWLNGYRSFATGNYISNANYICSKNLIRVMPNTTYYFMTSGLAMEIYEYAENRDYLRQLRSAIIDSTFVADADCYYIHIGTHNSGTTTYNPQVAPISINYPSTATDYEPYNGTTYPISLGQTVYGGVLDVTSGVLTVDKGYVDLGTLNWIIDTITVAGKTIFRAPITGVKTYFNAICSCYPFVGNFSALSDKTCAYIYGTQIGVQDSSYSDVATFRSAVNGQQLVYELATPITIQLTPTEISTLTGVNNIWADSGDIIVTIIR